MKKSILAMAVVAATSFNVMADDAPVLPTKPTNGAELAQTFNKHAEKHGIELKAETAENGHTYIRIYKGDENLGAVADYNPNTGEWVQNDDMKSRADALKLGAIANTQENVVHRIGERVIARQLNGGMTENGKVVLEHLVNTSEAELRQDQRQAERQFDRQVRRTTEGLTENEIAIVTHLVNSDNAEARRLIRQQERRADRSELNPDEYREVAANTVKAKLNTMSIDEKVSAFNDMMKHGGKDIQITTINESDKTVAIRVDGETHYVSQEVFEEAAIAKQAERAAERHADKMPIVEPPVDNMPTPRGEQLLDGHANLVEAGEQGATTMAELYATTEDNTLKINDLYNQIDRLDEKMDGVMASTQAVTSARPYLFNGQTSAIGVGIGAAGSEQAIAVGYAHRINENWSANANVSATSGNDTEVSAGAGVSFAW